MVNTYATMGHAYPPYSYMAPVNSSAFQTAGYQNYPQTAMYGQQMQYQQFAPHQQAYQPPQQYGRGTQHQAYQPPPQQMRQPQQNDPKAPVPKVPAPPVERRSKALSIMDPNTNQPVTLGALLTRGGSLVQDTPACLACCHVRQTHVLKPHRFKVLTIPQHGCWRMHKNPKAVILTPLPCPLLLQGTAHLQRQAPVARRGSASSHRREHRRPGLDRPALLRTAPWCRRVGSCTSRPLHRAARRKRLHRRSPSLLPPRLRS